MPRRGEARARGSKGTVGSEHAGATACGGETAGKQVYPSQGRPHLIIINVFADQLKGQKDLWAGRGRRVDWSHSRSTPRTISPLACRLPLSALSNPTCRLQGHTPPPIPLPRQPAGGQEGHNATETESLARGQQGGLRCQDARLSLSSGLWRRPNWASR